MKMMLRVKEKDLPMMMTVGVWEITHIGIDGTTHGRY